MKKLPQLDSSRSGMALVIVLGLISLLIISSVTFAILMRVERASSANARNTMMARQIVKSALYNSIATISANVGDAAYPEWYDSDKPEKPYWEMKSTKTDKAMGKARSVNFWKDTFGSIDHNIGTSPEGARAPALVMTYSAERYLPYAIRHRAYARAMSEGGKSTGGVSGIAPEWIPVATDADDVSKEGDSDLNNNASKNQNIVGRYAFMAFNTTGYLDLSAMISEYAKAKDKPVRFMGSSVAELSLKSDFFRKGTTPDKFFKDNEKVGRYDTVAEILDHNRKDADKDGGNDSAFADGATFSAFSYMPKEYAPHNSYDVDNNNKKENGVAFREKIYIGMNDPAEPSEELKVGQLEHIKKHKARIMKAFYDSGLRTSTDEYKKKAISEAKCDICGTSAYTLPTKYNSEQALWGYLGLIDYIDEDSKPAGDNDVERYGRPVTEASPLFNGFMTVIRLTRGDVVEEKDYELPSGATEKRKVLKSGKVGVTAEVVAKMAFTDRFGENSGSDLFGDAIYEGKIALRFDGGDEEAWKAGIGEAAKNLNGVEKDLLDEGAIVCVGELDGFPDVPMPLIKNFRYEKEVSASNRDDVKFPEMIYASAAAQVEMGDGVTQRIPADESIYENEGYEDWLTASAEPKPFDIQGEKVRVNVSDSSATHIVTTNVVHLVMWGEMLDPRFYHAGAYSETMPNALPKVALVSHDEDFDGAGFLDDYEKLPVLPIFNEMKNLMKVDGYKSFNDEFNKFKTKEEYFVKDYFSTTELDGMGYYTKFQKAFLENASGILKDEKYFGGHIDGSHLGIVVKGKESDLLANQWLTMHVKNKPLETVGELGHLPIGPWATIRLTGFDKEVETSEDFEKDDFWNNFNQLPEVYSPEDGKDVVMPFHTVLDHFTTRGATRGLINLNSPDPATLAMAFYDMPLDTETLSAVDDKDCDVTVTDSDAEDLASVLLDSWSQHNEDEDEPVPFSRLSQLGYAFEADPEVLGGVAEPSNYYREAAIRNSCGLFTTRGMTFTIIMRGEAFTPTFGRIAVSDEAGTTHATRTAIAQVWRDTEKNEDGIYPFFIQYFKILDD